MREAWLDIDVTAVAHNVTTMRAVLGGAACCAVVKADGYGHGAVPVAEAALGAGASMLAVALVEEGAVLRAAGIDAPVLVLSEPPLDALGDAVALDLQPTMYTTRGVEALDRAASQAGATVGVHLKVDTGMHRVGAAPEDAAAVAAAIDAAPSLHLAGVCTHLAVADAPDDAFTDVQLARFEQARADLARAGSVPDQVHAANSAAAITHPEARYDLARCGITIYGLAPSAAVGHDLDLRPALTLRAKVSHVKTVDAGEAISYGLRYRLAAPSRIATVPVGYADGVRRPLGERGGEVLIGGARLPIAGTVTMDQILVDCGPESTVDVGDEVVLLGTQGEHTITADEWARRLDTINYEIVCGFGPRLPRRYLRSDSTP